MAKRLREGFEARWPDKCGGSYTNSVTIATSNAETGTCCLFISGSGSIHRTDLGSVCAELYHTFSMYYTGTTGSAIYHWFAADNSTVLGTLRRNPTTGFLEAYVGGTLVATGTTAIQTGSQHRVEIRVKMADANADPALTGRIQVVVDADPAVALDIDYSGDTKPGTETGAQWVGFGSYGSNSALYTCYYDNWGINDTTGDTDNSWVGDIRLIPFYPNANGTTSGLTGSDGNKTDNYALVDDLATGNDDGDTTYVKATAEGQYDTYGCTDPTIPDGAIIKSVIIEDISRKTNAAVDTQARVVIRSGAADHVGAAHALAITYAKAQTEWATDPAGGGWDSTKINALEIGTEGRGAFA